LKRTFRRWRGLLCGLDYALTLCCAHALSEGRRFVLGAQPGEARLAVVFCKAGFTLFRRAAEIPFTMILEGTRIWSN